MVVISKSAVFFNFFSLAVFFVRTLQAVSEKDVESKLLARGEHRIAVQNYGHRDPEIPMHIMQANYYNAHHEQYMIRIEDLNQTLNKEINEDLSREYNDWFNAEYDRLRAAEEYYNRQYAEEQPQ